VVEEGYSFGVVVRKDVGRKSCDELIAGDADNALCS
jgi:hypothetical protein